MEITMFAGETGEKSETSETKGRGAKVSRQHKDRRQRTEERDSPVGVAFRRDPAISTASTIFRKPPTFDHSGVRMVTYGFVHLLLAILNI